MLERLIAKMIEKMFGEYFRGLKDEMHELNLKLTALERAQLQSIDLKVTEPLQWGGLCNYCHNPNPCMKTHIIC